MKKTILVLIAALFWGKLIFAQSSTNDYQIIWGDVQKTKRAVSLDDIFGFDNTGLYFVKKGFKSGGFGYKPVAFLEHYNNSLKRTSSIELKLEYNKKKMYYDHVIHFNNEIYLFSFYINKKLGKMFLFMQKVDKKTMMPTNQLTKVSETEIKGIFSGNHGDFDYKTSRDDSKLMIFNTFPEEKGKPQRFGLTIFDQNVKEIWSKTLSLPYNDELFDIQDYIVDNDGNVHIVSLLYKDKRKEKRKGQPNYIYQIYSIYNQGKDVKEYSIELEGKFITDMKLAINDQKDIICAGFYAEKSGSSIIGTYNVKLNPETKEIVSRHMNEFGVDYVNQEASDEEDDVDEKKVSSKSKESKKDKEKEKEMADYQLDEIIFNENGESYLIAEQYYYTVHTYVTSDGKGSSTTRTTYHYFYNDIIVVKMSKEGKIVWVSKIPKKQRSTNDNGFYSSYVMATINGKMNFFFNDHLDNVNIANNVKPKAILTQSKNSVMVRVELDVDGKTTKDAMFNTRDVEISIRPKVCKQISDNQLMIYGKRGKKENVAVITFR